MEPFASRSLQAVTLNTCAYWVAGKAVDTRSERIAATRDMHLVAFEHFTGIQKGRWSDNGHLLSLQEASPWERWREGGTGMEPTGEEGYFGYCGRDYYAEVSGIQDVMAYESLPAGTHVLVPAGATLYMHCYAANFGEQPTAFHHAVRVLYW
jgi:hypothetical protein